MTSWDTIPPSIRSTVKFLVGLGEEKFRGDVRLEFHDGGIRIISATQHYSPETLPVHEDDSPPT